MASNDVTEEILELLDESPDAFDALQRVLHSFSSVTIPKPDPGELFSTNEDKYLNLAMGAMEYAIFPHAARPAFSAFVGITTRESAWNWVVHQVHANVVGENWARASNLGKLAHAFSKMFFAMGRCEFLIYLTRDKADAWFDMWRIINETRMTRNSWTFLGLNFDSLSPSLQMFRTMAERNQYRICARYLRAMTSGGISADMEDVPDAQDRGDDDIDEEFNSPWISTKTVEEEDE